MELFSNLDQLEKNDEFYIHILGKNLAYKVFNVETVKPEEMGASDYRKRAGQSNTGDLYSIWN